MRVVFCTVPSLELGRKIARTLVEERLAACVQMDGAPIESCYRWEGEVVVDAEFRLLIKCSELCLDRLRSRVAELHSYSVPQMVDVQADANPSYLEWLEESCRG